MGFEKWIISCIYYYAIIENNFTALRVSCGPLISFLPSTPKLLATTDLFTVSMCGNEVAQSFRLFVTPRTVACQAPLSMGFSRQEYLRDLPFPSPGDLPNLGIKPGSPTLRADYHLSHQGSPYCL